jgi:microcompartment protein CcmK/EutM
VRLGRVVGTVVATRKSPRMEGFKLLAVRYVEPDGRPSKDYHIAVDAVGAGADEWVLTVSGSSAREDPKTARAATDTTIVTIVDEVQRNGDLVYRKGA